MRVLQAVAAAALTVRRSPDTGRRTYEYHFAGHAILGAPTWLQAVLIILGLIGTILTFRLLRIR